MNNEHLTYEQIDYLVRHEKDPWNKSEKDCEIGNTIPREFDEGFVVPQSTWLVTVNKLRDEIARLRCGLEELRKYAENDDAMAHDNGVLEPDVDGYIYGKVKELLGKLC